MNDEDMDTYVFAVGTRKALVRLQKEMQDMVCCSNFICVQEPSVISSTSTTWYAYSEIGDGGGKCGKSIKKAKSHFLFPFSLERVLQ